MVLGFVSGMFAGVCIVLLAPLVRSIGREINICRRAQCWQAKRLGDLS